MTGSSAGALRDKYFMQRAVAAGDVRPVNLVVFQLMRIRR
jgi:hypothetical protein